MSAFYVRGACFLRLERIEQAADCFTRALALFPDHAQSHLGCMLASRAMGARDVAETAWNSVNRILDTLRTTRPVEAAMVHGHLLTIDGRPQDADAILCKALEDAPAGFAAWTLPVEPLLLEATRTKDLKTALLRLSDRAR